MSVLPPDSAGDASACEQQMATVPTVIEPDAARLASLIQFAAAAGHEINNPLAVIVGRAQLLLQQERDAGRRQSLATIASQALRIRDMIGDVMVFADPPPPVAERLPVREILQELQELLFPASPASGAAKPSFSWQAPAECCLWGDGAQFRTVLAEILRNAQHPGVGATQIRVLINCPSPAKRRQTLPALTLRIRDDGCGLTAEQAVHLFDPFYSGRQAGRGLGFGLCKAWRLARQNQADLKVRTQLPTSPSQPEWTTEFQLRWPLALE